MNWMHSACLPQAPLHVTPKNGYVDLSVTPLSTLVPFSPLVHINGDNTDSPQKIPDTQKYTVTLNTIPHTSSNTLPSQYLATPFLSNTNKPKLHESCSIKSKPYSMLQIKNILYSVVREKFRNSFVLPKKYSVREINNFPKRYNRIFRLSLVEGRILPDFNCGLCLK